ncbi:conserved hypothetical protein [Heliomicrobium modesticaldum Ice1]|uniref:NAD-dependent deacetylase n=1 Tax=Heliobacterium modesticaldum (strain ATCC 51547 / Ice1) TaxID=498761 RepID=B0TI44_HELMI|nr:conserved hypothetical protein [Heliomicrobium modesticaldum Ice1]
MTHWAVEGGACLLIINAELTPLADRADWVIRTPAAEALDRIAAEVLGEGRQSLPKLTSP